MAEREDIALELAEKLWEFDRSERWHTKRPKQDWLGAVAALLRPHVEFEQRYRQLLWESHAGYSHSSYLYGDDGELQCNHSDCMIDFKRDDLASIDERLWQVNLKRAALPSAPASLESSDQK